jgi:hypothetical protein
MSLWLSIDPGLGGTGIAVWRGGVPSRDFRKALLYRGTMRDEIADAGIAERGAALGNAVSAAVKRWTRIDVVRAYLEEPAFMGGGPTARRGDLVKLALTAGAIAATVKAQFPRCRLTMVPVIEWKGNAPKAIVAKRVCDMMGWELENMGKENHELDAVGIGLHVLGVFR